MVWADQLRSRRTLENRKQVKISILLYTPSAEKTYTNQIWTRASSPLLVDPTFNFEAILIHVFRNLSCVKMTNLCCLVKLRVPWIPHSFLILLLNIIYCPSTCQCQSKFDIKSSENFWLLSTFAIEYGIRSLNLNYLSWLILTFGYPNIRIRHAFFHTDSFGYAYVRKR